MSKLFWIILCRCTALSTDYTGEKRLFFCLLSHSSVVFAKQPEKDQTGGGPWVCLFPQGEEIPGICQKELCWPWQTKLFERATRTKGYSVKGKGKENSKEELESRGSEARAGSSTVALQMCWVSRPRGLSLEAAGAPGGQLNVQVISASPFCPSSWWPCPDGSEGVAWCPLLTVPAQWLFAHSQMPLLFISSQSLPLPPLPSFLCSQRLLFLFLPMLPLHHSCSSSSFAPYSTLSPCDIFFPTQGKPPQFGCFVSLLSCVFLKRKPFTWRSVLLLFVSGPQELLSMEASGHHENMNNDN